MAKKKKAKKKATKKAVRKAAPRKRSAARKAPTKRRQKTRRPAGKAAAKTKKAVRRTSAKKKTLGKQGPLPPPPPPPRVDVWPYSATGKSCDSQPHGQVHAPPRPANGAVNFHNYGSGLCTIRFSNSAVFGTDHWDLNPGDNIVPVVANPGVGQHELTNVTIDGCHQGLQPEVGPTDIIVP